MPASGNMWLTGRQFWLGPARAGLTVRFWASTEVIHLTIAGARVKSVHSHLTVADLAHLVARGASNSGPAPIPTLALPTNGDEGGHRQRRPLNRHPFNAEGDLMLPRMTSEYG